MNWLITISRLLGFQKEFLVQMDNSVQRDWLIRINLVVACGLGLMALSVGLMVWLLSPGDWTSSLWALGAFIASCVILVKMHALLITLGALPLQRSASTIGEWRPSRLRLLAFTALAILLSQPLLLWMQSEKLQKAAMERVEFRTTVQFEAHERSRLVDRQQALLVQRAILNDEHLRVIASTSQTTAKSTARTVTSTRKALLVGASNYIRSENRLPNVVNDIVGMERKLRSMGYAVTVSMDDSRTEVRRKLEAYSGSLRSGDISLIYFSGHGLEHAGQNYFIPRDFVLPAGTAPSPRMLQDQGIAITPYIDDLTRERLRLHLLILDACRTTLDGKPRGLAAMQSMASRNVIVAMAASPGQEALDGLPGQVRGNSPYTTALLRNLDRDEDVGRVFRRVAREVIESTAPVTRQANLPPQTPWLSESVMDLEIKLLPPTLERKAAITAQANAKSLSPECRAEYEHTGNLTTLGTCMEREIGSLTRQIEFLESRLSAETGQIGQPLEGLLEWAVFFAERMRLMWTNYLLSFIGTVVLVVLMIAGLAIRDFLGPQALRSYEKIRYRDQRLSLRQNHFMNQSEIDRMSKPLRGEERLPRFAHWSMEEDFFSTASPRPALTGGIDTLTDKQAASQMWTWLQNPTVIKDQA
jgi:hypothetical protein